MTEKRLSSTNRCRHAGSWLMAGGYIEWCYVCGAIRRMKRVITTDEPEWVSSPDSTWVRPTGDKTDNPYPKLRDYRR